MSRKTKTIITVAGFLILFAAFAVVGTILGKKLIHDVYETKINDLTNTVEINKHMVCRAARDISAGEVITEDMFVAGELLMSDITGLFMQSDVGKYALVDIPQNTVLNNCMLIDRVLGSDVRYVEYSCFHISSNIHSGDKIDIRIRYLNGEDFLVLSKKTAEKVIYNTSTCFLSVSEREQLYMASAIYDTVAYGAVLYALVYEEPTLQDGGKVTYIPSRNVAKLIYDDESMWRNDLVYNEFGHIIYDSEKRKDLEDRVDTEGIRENVSNVTPVKEAEQANNNGEGNSISSGYTDPTAELSEENEQKNP